MFLSRFQSDNLAFCGLLASLLLISSTTVFTAKPDTLSMQSARIGEHELPLANRIQLPNVPGDYTLFVRCEAKILSAGNIEEIACYNNKDVDDAFFRAIYISANSATAMPAQVDNDNVGVLMLFSVIFRQEGDQQVIGVVPKHQRSKCWHFIYCTAAVWAQHTVHASN